MIDSCDSMPRGEVGEGQFEVGVNCDRILDYYHHTVTCSCSKYKNLIVYGQTSPTVLWTVHFLQALYTCDQRKKSNDLECKGLKVKVII